jgi:tellurite methyltransferase
MRATVSVPESPIRAFHRDEEGHWVADLACGHSQHVRHRPPMEVREWVLTEAGRGGRIGASLPCRLCRMPRLPESALEYQRTAIFDAKTTPLGLRKSHTTKAGVWGQIVVLEGRVLYVIENEHDASFILRPGVEGAIAPTAPHHVDPYEDAKFFVRFLR